MKKLLLLLIIGCICNNLQAQNVGGIWLSGTNILSDGTGMHNNETPVLAMEDSIQDVLTGTGGTIKFGDIKFRKAYNNNTIKFFQWAGNGAIQPTMEFKYYRQRPDAIFEVYLTITLTSVIVSRHRLLSPECSGSSCPPVYEEIALYYNTIKYTDLNGNSVQYTVNNHL